MNKQRLREWIKNQGLTHEELARRLGYHRVWVTVILNSPGPPPDSFIGRFAQAFGFDVAEQLFGDGGDADVSPSAQPAPAQERG